MQALAEDVSAWRERAHKRVLKWAASCGTQDVETQLVLADLEFFLTRNRQPEMKQVGVW